MRECEMAADPMVSRSGAVYSLAGLRRLAAALALTGAKKNENFSPRTRAALTYAAMAESFAPPRRSGRRTVKTRKNEIAP